MSAEGHRLEFARWSNVFLRGLMEAGIVLGFSIWGYHSIDGTMGKWALAFLAPAIGFGIWGAIDFRQLGVAAEPLRLIEELLISGLAALGFYVSGLQLLGWTLALLSIIHHSLVYLLGDRLLKHSQRTPLSH